MATYMIDEHGESYALPGPFYSSRDMQDEHRRRGGFYFESGPSFAARYHDLIAGAILVDSVRDTYTNAPREYRLTVLSDGRGVAHVPDPLTGAVKFATLRQARAAARRVCDSVGVPTWAHDATMRESEWGTVSRERQLARMIVRGVAS